MAAWLLLACRTIEVNGPSDASGMRNLPRKDYYGVLSLPPGVPPEVVKQRFRELARRMHPDVNRASNATARFREIIDAYQVLMDPNAKAIIDAWYAEKSRRHSRSQRAGERVASSLDSVMPRSVDLRAAVRDRPKGEHAFGIACLASLSFFAAVIGAAFVDLPFPEQMAASSIVAFVTALLAACDGDRTREFVFWLTKSW